MHFKDHFSQQAEAYNNFRPVYPQDLFEFLAQVVPSHDLAWDCATGNGQAAIGLAPHFSQLIATDASANQIRNARQRDNIIYRVATADHSKIDERSVDLITVAQALHWFDQEKFYAEAKRVLKLNGIIAIWTYNLLQISAEIDALVYAFYSGEIDAFWPSERCLVENDYRDIAFPFAPVTTPVFEMQTIWSFDQLLGYLGTWSAVQKYKLSTGKDPVAAFAKKIAEAWGDLLQKKRALWPMRVRAGRLVE